MDKKSKDFINKDLSADALLQIMKNEIGEKWRIFCKKVAYL